MLKSVLQCARAVLSLFKKIPCVPKMTKKCQLITRSRTIFLLLVTIVQLQNLFKSTSADKAHNRLSTCSTLSCTGYENVIKNNMNPNGDPCVDFYDYVCHNWANFNPSPPEHEGSWCLEDAMQYQTDVHIKNVLEYPELPEELPVFKQAKNIYRACRKFPFLNRLKTNVIEEMIKKNSESWPMFLPGQRVLSPKISWGEIDNEYIKLTGESAFFDYNVVNHGNHMMFTLAEPVSAYGMLTRFYRWQDAEVEHYRKFLTEIVKNIISFNYRRHEITIQKDIDDVLTFRRLLNRIVRYASTTKQYETMTIHKFQEMYNTETKSMKTATVNWLKKIKSLTKDTRDPYGREITEKTVIHINRNYFLLLPQLLVKTSHITIINHIHLYFLERHLKLTPLIYKELEQSYTVYPAESTGEIRDKVERWKWCILNHPLRKAITLLYINTHFPKHRKEAVEKLFQDAKELLKSQISESKWLDKNTKKASKAKVDYMSSQIGYPEWLVNSRSNAPHLDSDVDPVQVYAYYDQPTSRIFASAAYLQPPVYSASLPYVVDYGATVSILGHELYHGFGHKGLKHNEHTHGKIWWPTNMYAKFLEKSKCFSNKYNRYRTQLYSHFRFGTVTDDFPSTVDEDIADVMGLKLAYKGYKKKLEENKGSCEVEPYFSSVIKDMTCEKLFFVAFANTFCTSLTATQKRKIMENDRHSLPQIRVNGAVANMKEFSAAFNCSVGAPLNLARTCDIWKL